MKNGYELLAEFNKGKEKAKTLGDLQRHIASTLPGFAVSMNWSGEENSPLGYCNVFVHPPGQFSSLRPVYVIGQSEEDTIKRLTHSIPRLLKDLGEAQNELDGSDDDGQSYEYEMRERRRNAGRAQSAAKVEDKPAPARQRGPRKAIRDGHVVNVHR